MLPDLPLSADPAALRAHIAMLRRLDPQSDEVLDAIAEAEEALQRIETEIAAA